MDQNTVWPGWKTIRPIGRGSFGTVYEIQRDVLGETEKAALKIISIPQDNSDIAEMYGDGYDSASITSTFESYLKSIVAEYTLMRKMNGHTNVVNCDDIHYIQHDDGIGWNIYIKMELLTPLVKTLPTSIPDDLVIRMASDICEALKLCKKHGIIHRDIKPQNIFVSEGGDYKLGDFGIAKTTEKTTSGTKIGTYKYMAPEVYNNKPYGSSVDIYSLGLVMYWLLNERRIPFLPLPPHNATAEMEEVARQRRFSGDPLPAPKNGSNALKAIVLKACAYDPRDRYQSADDMLQALDTLRRTKANSNSRDDEEKTVSLWSTVKTERKHDKIAETDNQHQNQKKRNEADASRMHQEHSEKKTQQNTKTKYLLYILPVVIIIGLCVALFANLKCNHTWIKATCINPQFCEKCGDIIGSTSAHTWAEATDSAPKTCTVCGITDGTPLTVVDTAPTTVPTEPESTQTAATEPAETAPKYAELEEKIKAASLAHEPEALYDEPIRCSVIVKKGTVRRGCATDYKKLGVVRRNETVYVYAEMRGEYGKWYFIETESGMIGWVNNCIIENVG